MSNRGKVYKLRRNLRRNYSETDKQRIIEIETYLIMQKVREYKLFYKLSFLLAEFSNDFDPNKVWTLFTDLRTIYKPSNAELVLYANYFGYRYIDVANLAMVHPITLTENLDKIRSTSLYPKTDENNRKELEKFNNCFFSYFALKL